MLTWVLILQHVEQDAQDYRFRTITTLGISLEHANLPRAVRHSGIGAPALRKASKYFAKIKQPLINCLANPLLRYSGIANKSINTIFCLC